MIYGIYICIYIYIHIYHDISVVNSLRPPSYKLVMVYKLVLMAMVNGLDYSQLLTGPSQ